MTSDTPAMRPAVPPRTTEFDSTSDMDQTRDLEMGPDTPGRTRLGTNGKRPANSRPHRPILEMTAVSRLSSWYRPILRTRSEDTIECGIDAPPPGKHVPCLGKRSPPAHHGRDFLNVREGLNENTGRRYEIFTFTFGPRLPLLWDKRGCTAEGTFPVSRETLNSSVECLCASGHPFCSLFSSDSCSDWPVRRPHRRSTRRNLPGLNLEALARQE